MKTTIHFLALLILSAFALHPSNTSAQCPTGLTPMLVTLTTDANNQETDLNIHDLTSGTVLFTLPTGGQAANTTQTYTVCAEYAHCYKADLLDAAGNGGASFSIVFQSQTYSSATSYGHISTALMGTAACTDISPVLDSASYFIQSASPIKIGNMNRFKGSVLAGANGGNICMGDQNGVTGWVKGDKIGVGLNNNFGGYNSIEMFGLDWGTGVCSQSTGMPGGNLHVTPDPMSNTTDDCEDIEVVPSNNDIHLVGPGATQTIPPGQYGLVTLVGGAHLRLEAGAYSIEEIDITNAKLTPVQGGTLCEILISTDKLAFSDGSTVEATINCKAVDIGDDNHFMGYLKVTDPVGPFVIGDKNSFVEPRCIPCEEGGAKIQAPGNILRGKKHGSIEPKSHFEVWPNPSDTGEIKVAGTDAAQLDIFDLDGKHVESKALEGREGKAVITLDLRHLKPGLYIGKMTHATGEVEHRKIMLRGS